MVHPYKADAGQVGTNVSLGLWHARSISVFILYDARTKSCQLLGEAAAKATIRSMKAVCETSQAHLPSRAMIPAPRRTEHTMKVSCLSS